VCTHPDHRKRGLAGTVLAACMDAFRRHGADFVHISGALPLYIRAGARRVGGRREFEFVGEQLAEFAVPDVALRDAEVDDASWMAGCALRDPVHFVRPHSDVELSIRHGHCTGAACRFHIVSRAGARVAYLITTKPDGAGESRLFECAGPARAVLAACHTLVSGGSATKRLAAEFAVSDPVMGLLANAGLSGVDSALPRGTMKAVDFVGTMVKLRPFFAARLPEATAAALDWAQGAERFAGWAGGDMLTIDGEQNMLWTLLGPPPDAAVEGVRATGAMADLLETCLPLPVPSIYVNNI